jgi:hypothetical protein
MKIIISLPDEIAERVRQLPDSDEFVARAVEAALSQEPQTPAPAAGEPSKWVQMIERIESQPSLGSYIEQWNKDRREFRESFHFPHDER